MDPQAALDMATRALKRKDYDTAGEHLEAYWDWRRRGGFQPKGGDRKAERLGAKLSDEWPGGESGWGEAGGVEDEGYEDNPRKRVSTVDLGTLTAGQRKAFRSVVAGKVKIKATGKGASRTRSIVGATVGDLQALWRKGLVHATYQGRVTLTTKGKRTAAAAGYEDNPRESRTQIENEIAKLGPGWTFSIGASGREEVQLHHGRWGGIYVIWPDGDVWLVTKVGTGRLIRVGAYKTFGGAVRAVKRREDKSRGKKTKKAQKRNPSGYRVVLLKGPKKKPAEWTDSTKARARQRAESLADLHSAPLIEATDGFVVDASDYYSR